VEERMGIYCTADFHGEIDIGKIAFSRWPQSKEFSRENDVLIQLGDFGVIWNDTPDKQEKYLLKFLGERPYNILVVNGNHDNIPRLRRFPEIAMFGDFVRVIDENVFYLQNGHIYTIQGKTFFVMGGALSIDKDRRIEGKSWWPEEQSTYAEFNLGLENLKKVNNKVDYVVTHTVFEDAYRALFPTRGMFGIDSWESNPKFNDPMHKMLTAYRDIIEYKKWFYAHFHMDIEQPEFKAHCLYNKIVRVE
jgi:hypothetical protein